MSERHAAPVGIGLGIVLLAAVAGLGIALPEVTDDDAPGGAEETSAISLPDTLPHGLVAQDAVGGELAGRYADAQRSMADNLEELYDDAAAVRGYASEDQRVQATVTVLDRAPGLFDPDGPPVDPEILGLERSVYELVRVGDAICNLSYQQVVPQGQPVDETAPPAAVRCQRGEGERTIELFASGVTVEQAIEVLDAVAD